jgi:hypothetical protein
MIVTKEQGKDTGMVMVLIFMLTYVFCDMIYLLYVAITLNLFNMIYPKGYCYVASAYTYAK